jgi:hypothetical protein
MCAIWRSVRPTLDHFESPEDIARSLDEMTRGPAAGRCSVHHFGQSRWVSRRGWTPFELGQTVSVAALKRMLIARGMRVHTTGYLIHNPRGCPGFFATPEKGP